MKSSKVSKYLLSKFNHEFNFRNFSGFTMYKASCFLLSML